MTPNNLSPKFLKQLQQVTGKRSRIVVDHILKHGFITTEDLEQRYGYKHPPRAVKDVRDQGVPIETYSVKSSDGRTIAAYRFGDPSKIIAGRLGGRKSFSRRFKNSLIKAHDSKCRLCDGQFESRELQIDHRIPYEIAGDVDFTEEKDASYMLLCGSCNRTKSRSCEQCPNWKAKTIDVCANCYWAHPTNYAHVATKDVRRTDLLWEGNNETDLHEKVTKSASQSQQSVQAHIKTLLKNLFTSILNFCLPNFL